MPKKLTSQEKTEKVVDAVDAALQLAYSFQESDDAALAKFACKTEAILMDTLQKVEEAIEKCGFDAS